MILEIFRCVYYQNPSPWNFDNSISCENLIGWIRTVKIEPNPGFALQLCPYMNMEMVPIYWASAEKESKWVRTGYQKGSFLIPCSNPLEPTLTSNPQILKTAVFRNVDIAKNSSFEWFAHLETIRDHQGVVIVGWGMRRDLIPSHNSTEFKRVYSANGIVEPQSGKICIQGVRKRYSDWNLIILR